MKAVSKLAMTVNKVNNQNSDLDDLSENSVYLTKHIFTASKIPIDELSVKAQVAHPAVYHTQVFGYGKTD
jgi:hypothetical protein|tara:strand:- start:325 stop:534 length:210 start_codon:yes stop_codon:yes gene_type:complete